ncbi:Transcriptional regulatory protein ZraR [Pirellulimonas nuda]|uniref:Transcriptional regulatory protein ZraR n=1 Tax=Pirellulimonas nuda TaxID=2528009 RepID=A0A518D9X7_9BACT|nr:sigma-54 dependent transcriptional regulator [Pirellulimonas nuda]QDU88238.1 Transcriptional regulatory protein ZraR [Pirellulimonas nuda]
MSQPAPPSKPSVLVVDDHAAARQSVADVLGCAGYAVRTCSSAVEALNVLRDARADVVVSDLQMPGMSGLELVREVERRRIPSAVLMITAHASVSTAVEAMRSGAFDYLEKPFDAGKLEDCVARALDRRRIEARSERGAAAPGEVEMLGESEAMRRLRDQIERIARTDETVLICGESGVGKELVARTLHAQSRRGAGPFVGLNCPVLSEQLTESELFGHCRGAFTGADADRVGRFEQASGGSLLLDEVTEINPALQAKLLRVLQERVFERVGSSQSTPADVRVLATTNRDLQTEVSAGRFREDLYFRLAVVPIEVPPLRSRGGDVLLLAERFAASASQRLGRPTPTLEPAASQLLLDYTWPGNVRELHNVITRACVLGEEGELAESLLRPWLAGGRAAAPPQPSSVPAAVGQSLAEAERRLIEATLDRFGGHRARTAEALGIGVRTLSGKLRDYGYAPREKSYSKAG